MPIKKDLSAVPQGRPPDAEPRFVTAVAQAWHDQYVADGKDKRAMSGDTRFRGSDAGSCSFDLALKLLERAEMGEQSNPPTLSATWRMNIGSMVHDALDVAIVKAFPGATCEVVGMTVEGEASFHADILIEQEIGFKDGEAENWRTLVELKTINGTGFKGATLGYRKGSPPEGPRDNAVLQAALAAEAFDCDEVVVGYLALENIGPAVAKPFGLNDTQLFAAEWTFTKEDYLPLAEAERARFRFIAATVDAGRMPERTIPALPTGAVVTDPTSGAWSVTDPDNPLRITDVGTTWMCGYCWNADHCIALAKQGV